jgi:hypothetical protein
VRLLLAYMVLNRARHVGREELIGSLWPANPPLSQDAALRTLLRDELGTAPAPDTIAAHERLLHPSGRIARPAGDYRSPSEQPAIQLPAELRARGAGPLVGRVRELEQLEHRWELERGAVRPEPEGEEARLAPGGAERVVLLAGDPGIGKTRLIAELARRAHESGVVVLAGASPEDTLAP